MLKERNEGNSVTETIDGILNIDSLRFTKYTLIYLVRNQSENSQKKWMNILCGCIDQNILSMPPAVAVRLSISTGIDNVMTK